MANTAQARKRARQAEVSRRHNASFRSMVRTYIKKVDVAIAGGNYDDATTAYKTAQYWTRTRLERLVRLDISNFKTLNIPHSSS